MSRVGWIDQEDGTRRRRVTDYIEFILQQYAPHLNYYTMNNLPVIFLYLVSIFTRHLSCNIKPCSSIIGSCLTRESPLYTDTSIENDGLAPVLLIMRTVAAGRTINICLVGGQTFRVPSGAEYVPFNFATELFLDSQLLLLVLGTIIINSLNGASWLVINSLNGASWLVYRNANLFPRYRRA